MAISREKKEMTVEKAKQQLENCSLIASINYKKFTVSTLTWMEAKVICLSSPICLKLCDRHISSYRHLQC